MWLKKLTHILSVGSWTPLTHLLPTTKAACLSGFTFFAMFSKALYVKGLMQSNLAKSISDSSWSKCLTYLRYKAEWYGRTLIQVDRVFPSSKLCHCCGYTKEDLALHERIWTCPVCGTVHDRDVNASINLYLVGLERPEVKPVERVLPSVKQEAPPSVRWSSSQSREVSLRMFIQ